MKGSDKALRIVCASLSGLMLWVAWPLAAAEDDKSSDWDKAVEAVVDTHPRVRNRLLEAQSRWRAARAAGLNYPDPMIEFSRSRGAMRELDFLPVNDPMGAGGKSTGSEVRIKQPIPFPGKLTTQTRVLEAEHQVARIALAMERNKLASEYLLTLIAAANSKRLTDLTAEYVSRLAIVSDVARSRYSAGRGTLADFSIAEVRVSSMKERLAMYTGETQARRRELAYFLPDKGSAAPMVLDWGRVLQYADALHARAMSAGNRAPERSLDVRLAREEAYRREKLQTAAKLEYMPDFEIFASRGNQYSSLRYGTQKSRETVTSVGLNIRIPLWSAFATSERVDAETAGFRAADQSVLAVERKVITDFAALHERFVAKAEAVRLFKDSVIPRANQAREAAMFAYQAGSIPFSTLLDSWESPYTQQVEQYRAEEEHARHGIEMADITNVLVSGNDPPARKETGIEQGEVP